MLPKLGAIPLTLARANCAGSSLHGARLVARPSFGPPIGGEGKGA
jgi:hypothetical protein